MADPAEREERPDAAARFARCQGIWESERMNDAQQKLIEAIKGRARRGWGGMRTADEYVQTVLSAIPELDGDELRAVLKKQASLLTHNDDTMIVEVKQPKLEGLELPKNTLMVFRHVITSSRKDRDGDVLRPMGATIDPKMLLLWQHIPSLPIGKLLHVDVQNEEHIKLITAIVDMNELSSDAAVMVDNDMGRFSHGFTAHEFDELKEPEVQPGGPVGFDVKVWEMLEESIVSIPSNVDAEQEDVLLSLVGQKKLRSDIIRSWAKSVDESRVKSVNMPADPPPAKVAEPSMRKLFDLDSEHVEPSKIEFDWAARFLGCSVKDILVDRTAAGGPTRGSFLKAVNVVTSSWDLKDTRNLNGNGTEEPPQYENVQLNSKSRETFLVEGVRFWNASDADGQFKMCTKTFETWSGQQLVVYVDKNNVERANKFIESVWGWVDTNHMLKGEAFSLTGSFIERTGTKWDELFLPDETTNVLKRTTRLVNEKGKDLTNRGIMLMGPPGTGKTLSGRVMLNDAKATYIWISAKDFWRAGSIGGLVRGFNLARMLAPSILFIEDVDNWMSDHCVDVIKTEMDGVERTSGIVTVLTTNYPELMPKALIDRPGRFHDVLHIGLPDKDVRMQMVKAWVPDVDDKTALRVVEKTEGLSGAHIYELAYFAQCLREDDEDLSVGDSLDKALDKIESQRETINESQLEGSTYKHAEIEAPRRHTWAIIKCANGDEILVDETKQPGDVGQVLGKSCDRDTLELLKHSLPDKYAKYVSNIEPLTDEDKESVDIVISNIMEAAFGGNDTKAGRVLSKRNLQALIDVKDDLEELRDSDGMKRAQKALCERCITKLSSVIKEASPDEDEVSDKDISERECATVVMLSDDKQLQRHVRDSLDTILRAYESRRVGEELRTLVAS